MEIRLDDIILTVVHKSDKRIKRIGLSLENQNEIIIKTPLKFKANQIRDIIIQHKDWILRSLNKVPVKNRFDFICGGKIPFMGDDYPLEMVIDDEITNVKVKFENEIFYFYHNSNIDGATEYDLFVDGLKAFYKKVAIKYIDPMFDEMCFLTKLHPEKISYRYAKRQWGSCSYKNDISINYMLLQFPINTIRYVVLHELCHIEEKNHSARFYNLVSLYMSDYKKEELILKQKSF
ncbi:MAG: M48 family metallopeptidase [Epsilonproteobacteria bacterium]|nr:M48 family metallopeptidase [Campylobacterota bacterium]